MAATSEDKRGHDDVGLRVRDFHIPGVFTLIL